MMTNLSCSKGGVFCRRWRIFPCGCFKRRAIWRSSMIPICSAPGSSSKSTENLPKNISIMSEPSNRSQKYFLYLSLFFVCFVYYYFQIVHYCFCYNSFFLDWKTGVCVVSHRLFTGGGRPANFPRPFQFGRCRTGILDDAIALPLDPLTTVGYICLQCQRALVPKKSVLNEKICGFSSCCFICLIPIECNRM